MSDLIELPSPREEEWRWSDLSRLPDLARRAPSGEIPQGLPWIEDETGPRLLFVDGRLDAARSAPGPIEVGDLTADGSHPLGRLAGDRGWKLKLGRDHSPTGLVQIIHVSTGAADHLAGEIELDVDAQASMIETHVGEGWCNRRLSIRLFKSARLMHHRRLLGAGGMTTLTDEAVIGEGASLVWAAIAAGAADSRLDGSFVLQGEQAFAEASAALLARGQQRHDANFVIRHEQAGGMSRQVWRSVADDRSTCSVAARVEVARPAQKTDAEQSLRGLLLSRGATVNARPELEIFADDVKCAHGATVGQLDPQALFYLESRGVQPDEARGLLTRAFVADALDRAAPPLADVFHADAGKWFG